MKFSKADISSDLLIPVIALACGLLAALLLWLDISGGLGSGSGKQVGIIYFKSGQAERKPAERVVWSDLARQAPVYNHDTIRTDRLSEAVIELDDGSRIELNEESMIVLKFDTGRIDVALATGSLSTKSSGESELVINARAGPRIDASKGDVFVAKDRLGEARVAVLKGEASLQSPAATAPVALKEGEGFLEAKEKSAKIERGSLSLVSPDNNTRLSVPGEQAQVTFAYKAGTESRLEVSSRSNFSNLALSVPARGEAGYTAVLPAGVYYWRLKSSDLSTPPRRLLLERLEAPILYAPANNAQFSAPDGLQSVNFRWSGQPGELYTVHVSTQSNFTGARQITVYASSISQELPAGRYFWKVERTSGQGRVSSQTGIFSLEEIKKLNAPTLLAPRDGMEFFPSLVSSTGIMFAWQALSPAASYELEVSQPDGGRQSFSESNNFKRWLASLPDGRYSWRVRARAGNAVSPWSSDNAFVVSDGRPLKLLQPASGLEFLALEPPLLRWERAAKPAYRLQIARNATFSALALNASPPGPSFRPVDLAPGQYYWRVVLSTPAGDKISPVWIFNLVEPPAKTELIFPAHKSRVDMTERDEILFRWKSAGQGVSYNFIFRKDGPRGPILARESLNIESFRFVDLKKLNIGDFFWEVESTKKINGKINKAEAARARFAIELKQPDSPGLIKAESADPSAPTRIEIE